MGNIATFTLHIRNIVKKARDKMEWVLRVFQSREHFLMLTLEKSLFIIKKDWQCKAGRGRLPPYQSEDPSPTVPTYRGKKRKGNQLETKK